MTVHQFFCILHYTHCVPSVLRKFGKVDKHDYHVAALLFFLFCSRKIIISLFSLQLKDWKYPEQIRELQVIVIVLSLSVRHISKEANDTKSCSWKSYVSKQGEERFKQPTRMKIVFV